MESIVISTILCNILVGCVCVMILVWATLAVETIINDFKCAKQEEADEKRKQEADARDLEYHIKRMKALKENIG